jgi:DNA-binding beta-propeller fold protein YncE
VNRYSPLLKFTKAGKFVMQIGHATQKKSNQDTTSLWRPADVFVDRKTNELFVADGYGNKRIIVFEADTGEYKRMWGAFGNAPEDAAPAPEGAARGGAGRAADPDRVPAKELPPGDQGPSQFNIVHGVKVSNDGLVYVSDRGRTDGRRAL